jgi:hypothetical protein
VTDNDYQGLVGQRAIIGDQSWFIAAVQSDGTPGQTGHHLHVTLTAPQRDSSHAIVGQWRAGHDDIGV